MQGRGRGRSGQLAGSGKGFGEAASGNRKAAWRPGAGGAGRERERRSCGQLRRVTRSSAGRGQRSGPLSKGTGEPLEAFCRTLRAGEEDTPGQGLFRRLVQKPGER